MAGWSALDWIVVVGVAAAVFAALWGVWTYAFPRRTKPTVQQNARVLGSGSVEQVGGDKGANAPGKR